MNDFENKYDPNSRDKTQNFKPRFKGSEIVKSASLNILGHENNRIKNVLEYNSGLNTEKLNNKLLHHREFRGSVEKEKWLD